MHTTTILIDLDGTLIDPKVGIAACIQHALHRLGRSAPHADDLEWCIGPPLAASLAQLLDTDDERLIQDALAGYRERFSQQGKFENTVYAGIPQALAGLVEAGRTLILATSKPRPYAQDILEHHFLSDYFFAVHGSEMSGERSGPKAELLEHIFANEGVLPEEAIMVGDRAHDVIAAKACGLPSVGVLYGYGSRAELEAAGADILLETPDELSLLARPGPLRS